MDRDGIVESIFGLRPALIGMVHVGALPGTPANSRSFAEVRKVAVEEARELQEAGFSGLMIENMHDRPYLNRIVGPEIVAGMAVIGEAMRSETGLPLGIQILAGANQAALAAAQACGASFIRGECFVFAHTADEGLMQSDGGELLRYRRNIGADQIRVFVDVKKKHASHSLTADIDLIDMARAAQFFLADGVVVTGSETGRSADPVEVQSVAQSLDIPTLVGSGVTPANLQHFADADGFIVGSALKKEGVWSNPLDPARIDSLLSAFAALRSTTDRSEGTAPQE
ncbi:MAG: BtpA/SgcQ family protein [Acidobacteriota bacterium]